VGDSARTITLHLTLLNPPAGVAWAMQLGRFDLLPPVKVTRGEVTFEVSLEIVASKTGGARLRGAAVQGPKGGRFLYVNSGSRAGSSGSPWDRRAKVSLESIPLDRLLTSSADAVVPLYAEIAGTAKDGGPACASVPILRKSWALVKSADQ
jgi:hypothetical protein